MGPSQLSTTLFATLITSVIYGKLELRLVNWGFATAVISGIAITLFAKSVSTMKRKRKFKGELNLPLVLISSAIFLLATTVSSMSRNTCVQLNSSPSHQNVVGLWKNIHDAFVVYPDGAAAYLILIRTPAKTVIQTGQIGAIILADALVVRLTAFGKY